MNAKQTDYLPCSSCKRLFKSRGLAIHETACAGKRKKVKRWYEGHNPLWDVLTKAGVGKWEGTEAQRVALVVLLFREMGVGALYELSPSDRDHLGVSGGYVLRQTEHIVFVEFFKETQCDRRETTDYEAWEAFVPWDGAYPLFRALP